MYRSLIFLLAFAPTVMAGPITTGHILTSTLNPVTLATCPQWAVVGMCIWLRCGLHGCDITYSVKMANYNPDLVSSGHQRIGENPWVEAAAMYGALSYGGAQTIMTALAPLPIPVGDGDRVNEKMARSHEALTYKESDQIGHPLPQNIFAEILQATVIFPRHFWLWPNPSDWEVCSRETQPFVPYFLSGLDAFGWRYGLPDSLFPPSFIMGLREIGSWPINSWQAVYPRHGFTIQDEPPKAGAIVAQRSGDIVTRPFQPHVYIPTASTRTSANGMMTFWPGPLLEKKHWTGYFQMLTPLPSPACATFGATDIISPLSWADLKGDVRNDFAWNMWRPYRCCKVKGFLIGTIDWVIWPTHF